LLTDEERDIYQWQMWVRDFGEQGQRKLKTASVLVSRVGGVGGLVAYQLAAAGIGRLVLAHAGNVKPSDLNRQLLMTYDQIGKPRIASIQRRLNELNPRLEVVPVPENISEANADELVAQADIVVDCAPLFPERFAMNDAAMRQGKPMVECAMYELEAQITTFVPGQTPCLRCLFPSEPPSWTREFPVFGAVSGTVACMAAMEAIKLTAGLGKPLLGRLLKFDLRDMSFSTLRISPRNDCPVCSSTDKK
jgi:molybdopterin-synthase adenylyltransferase